MDSMFKFFPENDIIRFVDKLSSSLGDELSVGLKELEIEEKNSVSKGYLKWDLFNKNCIRTFSYGDLVARYARRGPWHMVPLVDFRIGYIFTVMRMERFKQLSKSKSKRKKAHYVDAFVESFNFDVRGASQLSIFLEKQFGEDEIAKIVDGILNDMQIDKSIIQKYAVILFDEFNHELISLKCCIINSELEIVDEEDWSSYIKHKEPLVTEVFDKEDNSQYQQSVQLSAKAKNRAKQRKTVDEKKKQEEQKKRTINKNV